MDQIRAFTDWIQKRKLLSLIVVLIFAAGFYGVRYYLHVNQGKLSEPLKRGKIVDAVYGIGTVTAYHRRSFNPLVGNTLRQNYVREGDVVKKGAPLAMTEGGNTLVAPFDGVVTYFPYRVGENAYTTSPMMVVTDMSDRYVVVSMEQQGALRVKAGQDVKISFDSLRQQSFDGKVAAVYSYNSNFLARIDSVNLPLSVLPDMTCDVAIVIGVHENALIIPIVAFDNGNVWVKRGSGLPHPVAVKLGVVDSTSAEILEGDVQPGDQVMIRDQVGP